MANYRSPKFPSLLKPLLKLSIIPMTILALLLFTSKETVVCTGVSLISIVMSLLKGGEPLLMEEPTVLGGNHLKNTSRVTNATVENCLS